MRLPPEYHPMRNYPAVVVLHSGKGPDSAINEWAAEAARRGYILIAPEFISRVGRRNINTRPASSLPPSLRCATPESGMQSTATGSSLPASSWGGTWRGTWRLSHPDLFAGVVVISGLPAKYVPKYLPHHERVPLFYAIGDLAPAANEFIYSKYIKPLILKTWDITYVEYFRRGLEALPEEIPAGIRLDGPPAPRPDSQGVQGEHGPRSPTTGSTASWFANSKPAEPQRPRPSRCWAIISSPPRSR